MLLLLIFLSACASSPQTRLLLDNPPDIAQQFELSGVPFFPQLEYHCGPAALAAVISYWGTAVQPDQIAPLIYVPELQGSLQTEVVSAARQFDMLPVLLDGRLESIMREIEAGNPVFVLQNLGIDLLPVWHYEIVIGYNFAEQVFILRSGKHRRIYRRFSVFEQTWRRAGNWALVIVDTDSVPQTATEQAYLDAVIDMEQVGRIASANKGFQTARTRWPNSSLAHIGYGNTSYALNQFSFAEQAYLAAIEIDPENAALWNNFAYALAQIGKQGEAMHAIRTALLLDPENKNYQESLEELSNW